MARTELLCSLLAAILLAVCGLVNHAAEAGIIKDLFQKVTHSNNKTEDTVKQSAPICGSGLFSTPNEASLSPEIIFISTKPSRLESVRSSNNQRNKYQQQGGNSGGQQQSSSGESDGAISREFRFHADNVTIEELQRYGFNPAAPVSFLIHGFTSGYPLQAWISAIVEAYTIDRETFNSGHTSSLGGGSDGGHSSKPDSNHHQSSGQGNESGRETYENEHDNQWASQQSSGHNHQRDTNQNANNQRNRRPSSSQYGGSSSSYSNSNSNSNSNSREADHNLFIVNWNYAARGILYPRAVANIPIVASYLTRFINEKLLAEARVDPNRVQLIGHSLGAHLAGFVGKNTRPKVGRIYGLDPAGPCFGALAGPLYPSSKRLAPTDANEVITIQTNSALLGIEKPLGKYSVFVEGGANQPGCKPNGVLKSVGTLTWDGGDFDTVACSHSRAPNLLTHRHGQSDSEDSCQMVAYACKDWQSFLEGRCGVCRNQAQAQGQCGRQPSPLDAVQCYRIGLDWQYPASGARGGSQFETSSTSSCRPTPPSSSSPSSFSSHRPTHSSSTHGNSNNNGEQHENHQANGGGGGGHSSASIVHDQRDEQNGFHSSTRRPASSSHGGSGHGSSNNSANQRENNQWHGTTRRAQNSSSGGSSYLHDRQRRDTNDREERVNSSTSSNVEATRRSSANELEPVVMFLRTGDTQPYCTFHYQVVLELNESFGRKRPPMSIILQDSEPDKRLDGSSNRQRGAERNSLSSDEFGHKFDDRTYTHLLTSNRKLARVDQATMIFREGLQDGHRLLKALQVNYMSHADERVRDRLSARLCPVRTEDDRSASQGAASNRFYFRPCARPLSAPTSAQAHGSNHHNDSHQSSDHHGNSNAQFDPNKHTDFQQSNSNQNSQYNSN